MLQHLLYLLKSCKLIQQYTNYSSHPSGTASPKTTTAPKTPTLQGWTFSLGIESG